MVVSVKSTWTTDCIPGIKCRLQTLHFEYISCNLYYQVLAINRVTATLNSPIIDDQRESLTKSLHSPNNNNNDNK